MWGVEDLRLCAQNYFPKESPIMTDLDKTMREYKALKASNRREFITRLGAAGLGVAAGAAIAGCGGGGGNGGFGGPANGQSGGSGAISEATVKAAFIDIQKDENDHVALLRGALGASARPRPTFDPKLLTVPNEVTLWHIASALENTGPGAYLYAAGFPGAASVLGTAASVAIVEGRHAGFLNLLSGKNILLSSPNSPVGAGKDAYGLPTGLDALGPPQAGNGTTLTPGDPVGFSKSQEIPQPPSQVAARAGAFLGTVVAGNAPVGIAPGTGNTYLNGGPGFPDDQFTNTTPTFAGDTSQTAIIVNYALFLEYLERDFYNINVTALYNSTVQRYSIDSSAGDV